ncbi:hypothetical protein GLYMA_10G034500v4 [Glycine max]|uniref:Uncharacterized protein n=1 Tax=Glycine max TaxID=3847 RepID=K7LH83_SOYBN|nr:hypothetical protein GYH30_026846 [Glycine max]KRH32147.1 hypothetical protein GLYMA_10G034500v4 [Glycine max]
MKQSLSSLVLRFRGRVVSKLRSLSCHVFPCYRISLLWRMTKTLNQHHHQFNIRRTNTLGTSTSEEKTRPGPTTTSIIRIEGKNSYS